MATSIGSPFGKINGRLGSVVGYTWKNKACIRSYSVPANPNTPAQQAQRNLLGVVVRIARTVLNTICNKFWDPFSKDISGYNAFVKANMLAIGTATNWTRFVFGQGSLEPCEFDTALMDADTIQMYLGSSSTANGLPTDRLVGVVINKLTLDVRVSDYGATRADAHVYVIVPDDFDYENSLAYAFYYRVEGGKITMVSPTTWSPIGLS